MTIKVHHLRPAPGSKTAGRGTKGATQALVDLG
jgi:hypothetical protein